MATCNQVGQRIKVKDEDAEKSRAPDMRMNAEEEIVEDLVTERNPVVEIEVITNQNSSDLEGSTV